MFPCGLLASEQLWQNVIAELYCEPCPEAVDILVVTAAVCILLFLTARAAHISEGDLQIAVARTYPVEAANVIEKRSYTGPLYNHYDWGGYLIWRLARMPVSIDGRTNVHDVARVTHSLAVWNGKHDSASDPELSAARLVISQTDLPLSQRGI